MKAISTILVLASVLASTSHASFYSISQNFETGFTANDLLDGSGWSSINVIVTNAPGIGFDSDYAVYFGEQAVATNTLNETGLGTARVWTDFRMQPALGDNPDAVPGDAQVHFYFDADGYIEYLDGDDNWTRATNNIFGDPVTAVESNQWQRISIFQDYGAGTYAIILNDVVIAQDIPFVNPAEDYTFFEMANAENHALLDEIRIHNSLVTDLAGDGNNNGTPDSEELDIYGYVARTLVVDDDFTADSDLQFQDISSALAVWRARDTLQVNDGDYGPVTVSNSVTLVGDGFTVEEITVANGATLTLEENVVVTGTITVESGAFLVANGELLAGTLTVDGTLTAAQDVEISGAIIVSSGAALNVSGTLATHATLTVQSGATLAQQANVAAHSVILAGVIDVGPHTLTVSDTVELTGEGLILLASAGTLDADTIIMANNTQIISTGGTLDNPLLTLTGTFTITGSAWNTVVEFGAIAQTIDFTEDFEEYASGTALQNLALWGWNTQESGVVITNVTSLTGAQSVILPDETQLALHIDDAQYTRIWTDFYLRPALGAKPDGIPEDIQVHFYFDSDGYIEYLDATTDTWTRATNNIFGSPAPTADSNSWHRVSIFQNHDLGTYALLLDGIVISQDVPFAGTSYQFFEVTNEDNVAYLDDIRIIISRPIGLTASNNHDPDPDADELHIYGYVARTLFVDDDFTDPSPPQFDEISDALAVWRERDILQVNDGDYGPITVSNSVTLVGDGFTVAEITVENGATLTLEENVVVTGGIMVDSNATLIASGTLDANNLTVVGDLSVDGLLTVTDTLTVPAGATLTLHANIAAHNVILAGVIDVGPHTLTVSDTVELTGEGQILLASAGMLDADTIIMANNTQIVSTGGTLDNPLLTLTGIFTITGSNWQYWGTEGVLAQTIPFSDDFESYSYGQSMTNQQPFRISGWKTEDAGIIVTEAAYVSGSQSVMLPDNTEISLHILRAEAPRVWTDFYLQPAFGEGPDPVEASMGMGFSSFVDNNGDLNVAQVDGTSTNWVALNTTASWHNNGVVFTNSFSGAFDTNRFTRVSVYQNFADQTFSVIIDGEHIIAIAMPFADVTAAYREFQIGNSGNDAYFDDILVTPNLPAFAGMIDMNDNGIDDRHEIHWYGNLESYAGVEGTVFRFR